VGEWKSENGANSDHRFHSPIPMEGREGKEGKKVGREGEVEWLTHRRRLRTRSPLSISLLRQRKKKKQGNEKRGKKKGLLRAKARTFIYSHPKTGMYLFYRREGKKRGEGKPSALRAQRVQLTAAESAKVEN